MEVDAYRFSKMASLAGTVVTETIGDGTSSTVKPLHALNNAFKKLFDLEVPAEDQVVFVSSDMDLALAETNELYRKLDQVEYKKDVSFTIRKYMGREIIVVPPTRFQTNCVLGLKGYSFGANSVAINFIVCRKDAVYIPIKYDKLRVFSPEVVQDYDGYKINVRIYHDLFIPDNKRFAVYASLASSGEALVPALVGTSTALDANNLTISGVNVLVQGGTTLPSKVKKYYAEKNTSTIAVGKVKSGASGTEITTGSATISRPASSGSDKTYVVYVTSSINGTETIIGVSEDIACPKKSA